MKAFGKILGIIVLVLLLLVVAAGFVLTHFFDPNDYKEEIRQLARGKANVELNLKGDIGWSLFPWLGLELHDTSVATLQQPAQPFADVQLLGMSVRVLPLLRKELQMSDIRVEGLTLSLSRDKNGAGNWENIGKPVQPATGTPPAAQPVPGEASKPTESAPRQAMKLDIDSLTVKNARIDYADAQSGKQYSVEGIELTTGAIREGSSIPLKLSAYLGTNQPVLRARTELTGNLRFDRALKRYQLEDAKLSGEASGDPFQGKTATFSAQGQLVLDQAAQVAEWNGLKLSVNQLRALGELKARELDKEPKFDGGLSIAPFNLREFLEGIGQTLPAMADGTTLSKLELATRLAGTRNSLNLDDIKLKLDDSSFGGSLGIADFSKQAIRAQLSGDRLNLDRYLPAKVKKAQEATSAARKAEVETTTQNAIKGDTPLPNSPTQQAWSDAPVLPIARLRALDLDIGLSLGQLTIDKLPINDASLKLRGQGGLLSLDDLRGELYDGKFNAKASLDVRQDIPLLKAQKHIADVPVERLLESQDQKPPVKGLLDLDADITTQGNSQKAWIDNLNGTARFVMTQGVLLNANLEQQLCQGIATLNRKSLSAEHGGKDTPFRELQGNLTFRNGVASNPDLKASIPGLTVKGDGDIDLRVLGMDYRIGVIIEGDKSDMPDPACEVNKRYVGIEWPLRCRGPLELGAKACRLDKDGIGKIAARLAGDRLNEKLEEKLGDKVSPELKDALKGLFKKK
ncbi:AsmA family protein [Pseudomonas sp. ZM23]|uniref:AsmA family protein n=1 Tax=Pseudomonas triclosanedens TaxID=2961893 RepID=A0ABY6ZWP9_9PSED|nr:AsmA family protein [Pseudomonas triclosanedens]MCP8467359.1 AsmA family protein [Pseudomonas triclosanedens]MCP8469941.1 AsmA family protein [Pseudomonas triclosanedens]MCP8478748.1 AsmA family protein [Pseudomonas triclosanedens]WAI49268.1 AsmA family protein [Pseudomonas triclosanedens]